jgi:hypothetical protein
VHTVYAEKPYRQGHREPEEKLYSTNSNTKEDFADYFFAFFVFFVVRLCF